MGAELCLAHDMGGVGAYGGPLSVDMQPYGCFILISDQKILGNSFQPIGGHITGKVTEDVIGQIYYIWFPRILWYDCKFNVKIVLFSKIKQNGQAIQTSFVEFRLYYVWQKHNTY